MRPHSSVFSNIYLVSELMETDLACVIRSPQELTDEHCQVRSGNNTHDWRAALFASDAHPRPARVLPCFVSLHSFSSIKSSEA